MSRTPEQMLIDIPLCMPGWVNFKGEDVFALPNLEETERVGRPMIDIAYCATKGLHGIIEKVVQYDKTKFKESKLK